MGSNTYVKNAIRIVEALITEDNPKAKLKLTARNPFPSGCKPELDVTPKLNNQLGLRFLQVIGILRWTAWPSRYICQSATARPSWGIIPYLRLSEEKWGRSVTDQKRFCVPAEKSPFGTWHRVGSDIHDLFPSHETSGTVGSSVWWWPNVDKRYQELRAIQSELYHARWPEAELIPFDVWMAYKEICRCDHRAADVEQKLLTE